MVSGDLSLEIGVQILISPSRSTIYTPIYWLGVYEGPDGPCMQVLSLRELAQPRLV